MSERRTIIRRQWAKNGGRAWPMAPEEATELGFLIAAEHLVDAALIGTRTAGPGERLAWGKRLRIARSLEAALLDDFNHQTTWRTESLGRQIQAIELADIERRNTHQEVDR